MRDTVIEFSRLYPHVELSVTSGNHDELYHRVLTGELDMVLNDQRRAFSDEFENYELTTSQIMADISENFPLNHEHFAEVDELRGIPCILISSKGGHATDEAFYREIIGFSGSFIYSESSEEARLLAVGKRGFLPLEGVGTIPAAPKGIRRVPLYRGGKPLRHLFCAFWLKERTGYYIEEFANLLKKQLDTSSQTASELS